MNMTFIARIVKTRAPSFVLNLSVHQNILRKHICSCHSKSDHRNIPMLYQKVPEKQTPEC